MFYDKKYIWSQVNSNNIGLPRPAYVVPPEFYYKKSNRLKNKFKKYLHKIIPIPWQSIPVFDEKGRVFKVNVENEKKAILNNLCSYCGVSLNDFDICIRWTGQNKLAKASGPRVLSDSFPFHIECMKQARIFCPFMRELNESEFKIDNYVCLKKEAEENTRYDVQEYNTDK